MAHSDSKSRSPFIQRLHLFEISDQTWFPPYLRGFVQTALTLAWNSKIPLFQTTTPARLVAQQIHRQLGDAVCNYVFIDFCSGAGGPTPSIEQHLNAAIGASAAHHDPRSAVHPNGSAYGPVKVVMTDLYPHVDEWVARARHSPNLTYIEQSVNAANAPRDLIMRIKNWESEEGGGDWYQGKKMMTAAAESGGAKVAVKAISEGRLPAEKKVFRLFSLAFHHFDDDLARNILKNTLETSDGIGIFELQERSLLGFLTCALFGVGILAMAPYYAWIGGTPEILLFIYVIPILPFVLVFDGVISALRTRTPMEVEHLLQTCQASGDVDSWEVRSGKEMFFWPVGFMNWIICVRRDPLPGTQRGPTPVEAQWMGSSTARRDVVSRRLETDMAETTGAQTRDLSAPSYAAIANES